MPEPTDAVQDYLKAIHALGGADRAVSTAELAARLGVRSPSVTGMLKRLGEAGWIDYGPGSGAKLTQQGVSAARKVVRRHRLVELFLHRVLGLDWSEVDAEAERLEHSISPRLEQAIADHLHEPHEDPHGHPIPTSDGRLPPRTLWPLADFPAGATVQVREVPDEEPARLRRWQELGLVPGARVAVVERRELDGTYGLDIGGRVILLGREAILGVRVEPINGPE